MKKALLYVFSGIFFTTVYIEIEAFRILPVQVCFLMMVAGTQIADKLAKEQNISNPACTCSYIVLISSILQGMVGQSEKHSAFEWIFEAFFLIVYVHYLYAFFELLHAYAKKNDMPVFKYASRWQMGIVLSSTLVFLLYCGYVFFPISMLYYAYWFVGFAVKSATLYLVYQSYRNSYAKGVR